MQETQVRFLDWQDLLEKGQATDSRILGLPWWLRCKESTCNAGDLGLTTGLGRTPGGGYGNPLEYSCLENPHGQRNQLGYSPWDHNNSDITERQSTHIIT